MIFVESSNDTYSEEEAAKRRDEAIKNMLNTPPQPHDKKKPKAKKQSKRS